MKGNGQNQGESGDSGSGDSGGSQQDQQFFEMADAFIELANKYGEQGAVGKVSSALLFAAARYNAFYVAAVENISLESERDVAMQYFTQQYQKMLNDNFEDYQSNPLPGKTAP